MLHKLGLDANSIAISYWQISEYVYTKIISFGERIFFLLNAFTSTVLLQVLIKYNEPPAGSPGRAYEDTLLGAVLSISCGRSQRLVHTSSLTSRPNP